MGTPEDSKSLKTATFIEWREFNDAGLYVEQMLFKLNYDIPYRTYSFTTLNYTNYVVVSGLTKDNGKTETYIFPATDTFAILNTVLATEIRPGSYNGGEVDHAKAWYVMGIDIII
jgi:hypothetical protein